MSIQLRSQFPDLILEDALPALEYIIQDTYDSYEPRYEKIFNVKDMKNAIAQTSQVSSLLPAGQVGEAEIIPLQRLYPGFSKTYIAVKYATMLASSQELIDDDQHDTMGMNARKLMRSFMTSVELASADIFNTGFSALGPDGKSLFATDHPLLVPGAGTSSNKLAVAADLSMTTLKALITLQRSTLDSAGNKIMIRPKTLLVSPENEFLGRELLKSIMLPDPANASVNSINSVSSEYNIDLVVWDYLTDSDAVFLLPEKLDNNLNFFWRKRPTIETDFDFKSEVALTKLSGRFVAGYSDWRGVVGTEGA